MPYTPSRRGGDEQIVYPIDHMRETAARLLVQAANAQNEHDAIWQQIREYTQDFDLNWRETIMASLEPYAARLRASYDWQINLAQTIFSAIDAIEGTDDNIGQGFARNSGGRVE